MTTTAKKASDDMSGLIRNSPRFESRFSTPSV